MEHPIKRLLLLSFYTWQNVHESYMKQCRPAVVPQGLVCGVAGDSVFVFHSGQFLLILPPPCPSLLAW